MALGDRATKVGKGLEPTLVRPQSASASGDASPEPGGGLIGREIIGQYVVREKLGEGGMGAVYLADQPSIGRKAVIKVLHPHLSQDPDLAARFQVEARAASQLSHPGIVIIYNFGAMEDGTLFLAMEHVEGQNLDHAIKADKRIDPHRAVRIAVQIAEALAEAHRRGVVHRDLKPSNVMLTQRSGQADVVKLLDFGIAKLEGVQLTQADMVCGTPQYMSPEQLRGEKLDGRSDLYSLGVVMFEMLTGKPPFSSDTPAGYMHKHLYESPPTLTKKMKVPPALEAAVMRALSKKLGDRPASAEAFARELEKSLEPGAAPTVHAPAPAPAVEAKVVPPKPSGPGAMDRALTSVRGLFASAGKQMTSMLPKKKAGLTQTIAKMLPKRKQSLAERLKAKWKKLRK